MSMNLIALLYLVASVFFIQALKGLSHPTTSIRGNVFGMTGMTIAVLTTIGLIHGQAQALALNFGEGIAYVLGALVIGGGAGGASGVRGVQRSQVDTNFIAIQWRGVLGRQGRRAPRQRHRRAHRVCCLENRPHGALERARSGRRPVHACIELRLGFPDFVQAALNVVLGLAPQHHY